MVKAGKETIKYINKQNILNSFKGEDVLSKADLLERTKLSAATVSSLIQELVQDGLLLENRFGESSGGRKPMLYNLNGGFACILALRVTPKGILMGAVNLCGTLICHRAMPMPIHDARTLEDGVLEAIGRFKAEEPELCRKVTAVAFSLPGIIDYTGRRLAYSAALYAEDISLQRLVDAGLGEGMEVYVFKDTDALLLGEYFAGVGGGRSMAYVLCDNGVGLSVITRGKLFRADNCGMELGHTVVDLHGERCKCSAVGCVGTLLGEQPALRRYAQICRQEDGGLMPDLCRLSYDDLVTQSLEGDAPASQVIAEQLDILSVTLTNVINLFNPEVLVLGGPLSRLPSIEHAFAGQLKARSLKPFAQNLSVVASRQGLDAALGGMAHFVLDRKIFKSVKI